MWEALKRMKKGKSSGPSEVSYKIILHDVCKRAVLSNKWPVDERDYARVVEEEHGCSLVQR